MNKTRLFFLLMTTLLVLSHNVSFTAAQGPDTQETFLFLPLINNNFDPSWQFQLPVKVKLDPPPLSTPHMIVDSSGRSHIFWDTYPSEETFIYHTYLTEQGWTPATPIAKSLGSSKLLNPPVAGKKNDLYLVWYNQLNSGGPYRILYAAWDGMQWGPEYELLGDGKTIYMNGMVRLDEQGIPNVALVDSDGFFSSKIYFQKWTGNSFSARQLVERPANTASVWLDTSGGIRFFGDDYNQSTYYSHWKDGNFLVKERRIPGKINFRSTFLDGSNNLHTFKTGSVPIPGGNVTGLYHQCLQNNLSWSKERVLSGQENIQNSIMAFDENIQPMFAWSTNATTIHVTFWNGCEISKQKKVSLPHVPDSNGWGSFISIAQHTQAGKVCLLSKEQYVPSSYLMTCTQ